MAEVTAATLGTARADEEAPTYLRGTAQTREAPGKEREQPPYLWVTAARRAPTREAPHKGKRVEEGAMDRAPPCGPHGDRSVNARERGVARVRRPRERCRATYPCSPVATLPGVLDALDGFFRSTGRKIYLSSEIAVFYPGERRFSPDVLAVTDVEPHERMSWVVATEGKGLDFVLEVHVAGDRRKDEKTNVERYARLGIQEYFYFDRPSERIVGYQLAARGRPYQRIVPQAGRFPSHVLGLDLALDGPRLRFYAGNAPLADADEMVARLGSMLDDLIARQEDLTAKLAEAEQGREEAEQEREEAEQEREEARRLLAEALAEIERLKKG
jgi:hypothetical protein